MHGLHLGVHRPILDGLRAVLLLSQNQNQSEIDKIAVCCCGNDNPSNNISKAVAQLTELILPSRRTGPQHGQEITVCYILGGKSEVLLWLPHAKRHMPKGWSNVCCDYVCRVPRPGWSEQGIVLSRTRQRYQKSYFPNNGYVKQDRAIFSLQQATTSRARPWHHRIESGVGFIASSVLGLSVENDT